MQARSLRRARVADGGFLRQQQREFGPQDLPVRGRASRRDLTCVRELLACKLDLMLGNQPGHPSPPEPAWLWRMESHPADGRHQYLENF
jgi:hypothetical protein